jgi:hypothetical protein
MLVAGHAVGEKGERRTRHNNSTARTLFGITKEEEDQKKIQNEEETLVGNNRCCCILILFYSAPFTF